MAANAGDGITIRRLTLDFPPDLDPVIIEGEPEQSFNIVGLSLLLPYLEPYLIRTMRAARKHVTDPELARDLDLFNGQEGQHYRQHVRFNEAIRFQAPEPLKALEEELDRDYRRFTETKSLRFNLAYAEGFEAFTCALARFSFEERSFDRMRTPVRELFAWHLVEEIEHRTVAFDVYDHVCGGYLYRLAVGLFAQWHLNRFVLRVTKTLKEADPEGFREKYGGSESARKRMRAQLARARRGLLPKLLATYMPWYTPHTIAMPADAKELAEEFSRAAEESARARASAS